MSTQTPYKFILLREEAIDADLFEHKTHERVAETLLNLIKNQEGGVTVGLEGSWGSGKSTVISILSKLVREQGNDMCVMQFDAWAHEGDPLRRIFLESLIDKLEQEGYLPDEKVDGREETYIEFLRKRIANRYQEVTTKTKRFPKPLGMYFAIASVFVPFGLAFSASSQTGSLLWCAGVFLTMFPVFVLFGNVCHLKKNKKKVNNPRNWGFQESTSQDETTRQVSKDKERSSIEFELFFSEIMEKVFSIEGRDDRRLVMVLDNLDRIDPRDSLKIWSTLQTFLQQRNSPSDDDNRWFNRLWIVVPYDHDGLAKLWESKTDEAVQLNDEDPSCVHAKESVVAGSFKESVVAGSFFDKCFQIRLEVPKPLFSGWKTFASEMIGKSLVDEAPEDQKAIFDVLELTRQGLSDIPTPREIKVFINQVGVLRSQFVGKGIPANTVAYYVVLRTLRRNSIKDVRNGILDGKYPEKTLRPLLSEHASSELSGLLFGVSSENGMQLLLEPEIEKALAEGDPDRLSGLEGKHGTGFWAVFNPFVHKINSNASFVSVAKYTQAVCGSLYEGHKPSLINFKSNVRAFLLDVKEIPFADDESKDAYLSMVNLFGKDEAVLSKIHDGLINSLNLELSLEESDHSALAEISGVLFQGLETASSASLKRIVCGGFSENSFAIWAGKALDMEEPLWKWILPTANLLESSVRGLPPNQLIDDQIKISFRYVCKSESKFHLKPFSKAFSEYIASTNNNPNFDPEVMEFACLLAFKEGLSMKEAITDASVYNSIGRIQEKDDAVTFASLLYAKYEDANLSVSGSLQPHGTKILQQIKAYWDESDAGRARWIIERAEEFDADDLIWMLLEKKKAVAKDAVELAMKDLPRAQLLFSSKGVEVDRLWHYMQWFDDQESEDRAELIGRFVKYQLQYGALQNELVSSDLEVVPYAFVLKHIVLHCDEPALRNIKTLLKALSQDVWREALATDDEANDTVSLSLRVNNLDSNFHLSREFMEALLGCIKEESLSTEQEKDLERLINLLSDQLRSGTLRTKMTSLFVEHNGEIHDKYWDAISPYLKVEDIFSTANSKLIAGFIESVVESNSLQKIGWIVEASKNDAVEFPDIHDNSDLIANGIRDALLNSKDEEHRNLFVTLGEVLGVDLSEPDQKIDDEGEIEGA